MHNQGKTLLTHCPSVLLSQTKHTGQCQFCTSLLLALSQSVAGCLLSDLPKMVTLPLSVTFQKSISPESRENESSEDPKEKLSISCIKSTPLPIVCIFCA